MSSHSLALCDVSAVDAADAAKGSDEQRSSLVTVLAAQPLGGMAALRHKSLALTDLFIALVEARCAGHGLGLATPREHAQRGSQVCLTRDTGAYAIVQALTEMKRGAAVEPEAGALTRTLGASQIVVSRVVPGPVEAVRRAGGWGVAGIGAFWGRETADS